MRDFVILFIHLIVTVVRLALPGGLRSIVAESVLVRHQLCILNRGRKRALNTVVQFMMNSFSVQILKSPSAPCNIKDGLEFQLTKAS